MIKGSSGGPWFSTAGKGWQVIPVNSYGPQSIMIGPSRNHWETSGPPASTA